MSLGPFGKYELLHKVGSGGMGELYLARLPGIEGFEKLLVIKRILPHLVRAERSAAFVDMFLEEARLAARLSHPNIVQIHDLGKVDDIYYIAMEYVHGVDLRRLLRKGEQRGRALPLAHAVKICSLLCEALAYAHDLRDASGAPLNLVHRDVSPHNVLVAFDGGVKLTDFGIAKVSNREMQTKAGTLKGKLRYMSPEQAEGGELDRRSDLFAVGVLLYELSTGRRPFDGPSEFEIMEAIVRRDPPDPRARIPDYPADLVTILERALAKDPAQRYQRALDLQLDLERFLVDHRLLSSAALIGKHVAALFDDVVPALADGPTRAGDTSSLMRRLVTSTPSNSPLEPDALEAMAQTTSGVFADGAGAAPASGAGEVGVTRRLDLGAEAAAIAAPSAADDGSPALSRTAERELRRTFRSGDRRRSRWLPIAGIGAIATLVAIGIAVVRGWAPDATPATSRPDRIDAALVPGPLPGPRPEARSLIVDAGTVRAPMVDAGLVAAARADAGGRGDAAVGGARPAPAELEYGTLTLASKPWAEVYQGRRSLGLTPLAELRLPAGAHRLLLKNPREGLEKTIWVRIRPGQNTALKVDLRQK